MSAYYKWYRRFFGCSQIKIEGEKEALLNRLTEKEVDFWGTEVTEDGALTLYGSVFSARHIIEEGEDIGCAVSVLKRTGLPFIAEKYKKRYGIMIGFILAWAFMFFSSLFIWEVRVAPRSGEDPEKVMRMLEGCGLEMGTFLPSIRVREIENQFLLNHPEYSFFAVNVNGTIANIELRRAAVHEGGEENKEICNVVASKRGTILSIEAYGGAPEVKVGDTVSEGDLLISAYMQGRLGVWRGVHAYGKVTAAVYYDFTAEIPLDYPATILTGDEETKTSINILGVKLDFFASEETSFRKCSVESANKQWEVFGIKLPVTVQKSVYREEEVANIALSPAQAEEKAKTEFRLWMEREIKGEVLSQSSSVYFDEVRNVVTLTASVTAAEDIGIKQYIGK